MKRIFIFLILAFSVTLAQPDFQHYFDDSTLRFDYYRTGNAESESISFAEMKHEPIWGGSFKNLIDTLEYGAYLFKVWNANHDTLLYSRGYSTLFKEWQTTDEAKTTVRTFYETVTFPFPKVEVVLELYSRNKKNEFEKIYEYSIDPDNYFINRDDVKEYESFKVHYSGNPHKKLDILFLPEGYTKSELEDFKSDCNKFKDYIFSYTPFDSLKDKINIWGVLAPSYQSGTDIPGEGVWKKTLLNSSYYTFDSERYLMTYDYKSVRDLAANAPYDQIYILVNSAKYGGGSIYNYYSVTAAKNEKARQIFIHEFGHGFAGLADEYYTSEVSYKDFYPQDVEPWEPNITTLVNFEAKWKDLISPNIPVPTPAEDNYKNITGVFEGAGYVAKGVYRSTINSIMKSFTSDEFNEVSKRAIRKMILFYSE